MVVIRLFCSSGMSTSLLVDKMKKAAEKKGIEVDIEAYPEGELDNKTKGIDVALLGPQIAYKLASAKAICGSKGVPVEIIPMADYGMMNGEKVLELALKLIK